MTSAEAIKNIVRRVAERYSDGPHGVWSKWATRFVTGIDQTEAFAVLTMKANNDRREALSESNKMTGRELSAAYARTYACGAAMCWAQSLQNGLDIEAREAKEAKAEEYIEKAEGLLA